MNAKPPSWDATGLIERAWLRMTPATQEELRRRLKLSARTNLSKLNNGSMRLTLDYAERITSAVRQDDPTFTISDLGAPSSVVAEADPTVLDRLRELGAAMTALANRVEDLALTVAAQALEREGTLTRSQPTSRRTRKVS